jgi:DNA modification methylase
MSPAQEWPADRVERRPVAALVPYARNARTHSDAQVEQLAASIREWGWTMPVLVDEAGVIIAGHGRVLAAQRLGIAEVPVMVARGWTDEQRRAYVLADNRLALNAGWDPDLLGAELQALDAADFDLPLIGFDDAELAKFLQPASTGLTDPDDVPEPQAEVVAAAGDVWVLGRHRLMCGDATDAAAVERLLAGMKPHLMVTDPPYGVKYDANWRNEAEGVGGFGDPEKSKRGRRTARALGKVENDDRADWREAWTLFPGDVAYVWHAGIYATTVAESLVATGFDIRAQIIWAKNRFAISRGHYHWQHEPCWYAVRKGRQGHWCGDRTQSTLWEISHNRSETGHSTQKPVECMKRPIENNSSPGQAVYEPFSGSGTTIIAAEVTGRCCYAMEISPTYVDVTVRRWQEFTGEQATLEGDGRTFAEVQAERQAQSG